MKRENDPDLNSTRLHKWNCSILISPRSRYLNFALCLLAWFLTACSLIVELKSEKPLIGPVWVLESIQLYDQEPIDVGNNEFTLRLKRTSFSVFGSEEGQNLEGHADCNGYHGKYIHSEDDRSISITFLFRTNLGCGEDSLDLEFYSALSNTTAYTISKDILKLTYGPSGSMLVFRAK